METHNPYQPPQAVLRDPQSQAADLAGRGQRLGAALLDTLFLLILFVPLMYVGGYFSTIMAAAQSGQEPSFGYGLMWIAIGFLVFVALQAYPLSQTGQTWGKRIVGIKIVDLNGDKPSLGSMLGRRYLPVQLANAVPLIGPLAGLVNVLFIFRDDRRCLHDLIAGTRVVSAH